MSQKSAGIPNPIGRAVKFAIAKNSLKVEEEDGDPNELKRETNLFGPTII